MFNAVYKGDDQDMIGPCVCTCACWCFEGDDFVTGWLTHDSDWGCDDIHH